MEKTSVRWGNCGFFMMILVALKLPGCGSDGLDVPGTNHAAGAIEKVAAQSAALTPDLASELTPEDWGDENQESLPQVVTADSLAAADQVNAVPGRYIVAFKDLNAGQSLFGGFSNFFGEYRFFERTFQSLSLNDARVRDINYISAINIQNPGATYQAKAHQGFQQISTMINGGNAFVPQMATIAQVVFTDAKKAGQVLAEWRQKGLIYFADPEYESAPQSSASEYINSFGGMDGPILEGAWWHKQIHLGDAYNEIAARYGGLDLGSAEANTRPLVAVLDSGVDYLHDDLKDNIWQNPSAGESSCISDTFGCNTTDVERKGYLGNGKVYPYATPGPGVACPPDKAGVCEHGTHVSGIIAGKPNQTQGASGVCPMCQIMVLRVVSEKTGKIPDSAMLNAFKYVSLFKKNGVGLVRVINSSFGKFQRSRAVGLMVRLLMESGDGVLVIGAAGNEDSSKRSYPAAFTDSIAVSAVDPSYKRAPYSNFGAWVDIAAPGGGIEGDNPAINSTVPSDIGQGRYNSLQGTSMAAPMVSGVAGLLLAIKPELTARDLRERLLKSANPEALYGDDVAEGYNQYYYPEIGLDNTSQPLLGSGLLDASAAVKGEEHSVNTLDDLDRVGSGCGILAMERAKQQAPQNSWLLIFLWSLPMIFTVKKMRKGVQHHASRTSVTPAP